ncbi:MAG: preprotein translocase subunit SecG [Pseudomonadota bacterium]|nr:preprotein translocase subunit SecG [Pseudomonadota bacterium]
MYIFVVTLHVVLCLILVLVILMQPGKGGDISSAFGGGSSSQLFGAAGPGNFLTRGTGIVAGLFMVTSITLALYSTQSARGGAGVDDELENVLQEGEEGSGFGAGGTNAPAPTPAPAAPAPADAPAAPAPTPDAAPAEGTPAPEGNPAPAQPAQ